MDHQMNLTVSAVKHGCLPALEYLKDVQCMFHHSLCTMAARAGNLPVLQWLLQQGCPMSTETCAAAAEQ